MPVLDEVKKGKVSLAHRARSMGLCQACSGSGNGRSGRGFGADTELGTGAEGGAAGAELHTRSPEDVTVGQGKAAPAVAWGCVSILGQDNLYPACSVTRMVHTIFVSLPSVHDLPVSKEEF